MFWKRCGKREDTLGEFFIQAEALDTNGVVSSNDRGSSVTAKVEQMI